jgi:hypothetical protein
MFCNITDPSRPNSAKDDDGDVIVLHVIVCCIYSIGE